MNRKPLKILLIAGARPNFMKIAPLAHELKRLAGLKANKPASGVPAWKIVHTGQHYDYEMSKVFFEDFDIPEPDYFLNAGSGSHAEQTAKIMTEFEKVCAKETPDVVVVVGDVNSTLACSITAKKMQIKVAHVEAGLRSRDMTMPEEINRIVTDSISDYLFVSEKSGVENLKKEGKDGRQIFFVGNIMIDTLQYCLRKLARQKDGGEAIGQANRLSSSDGPGKGLKLPTHGSRPYGVCTLHRPSNVDHKQTLSGILEALSEISIDLPVYFPVHPRTQKNIESFGLSPLIQKSNIKTMPPQSYLDFLSLWKSASVVLTDSGGIQEETTALGIPCFTIRENTERPITIDEGTNVLAGTTREGIMKAYEQFREGKRKEGKIPELWDGRAAERIIDILVKGECA